MIKELRLQMSHYQALCDQKWSELEESIDRLEDIIDDDYDLTADDVQFSMLVLNLAYLQVRLNITRQELDEVEGDSRNEAAE